MVGMSRKRTQERVAAEHGATKLCSQVSGKVVLSEHVSLSTASLDGKRAQVRLSPVPFVLACDGADVLPVSVSSVGLFAPICASPPGTMGLLHNQIYALGWPGELTEVGCQFAPICASPPGTMGLLYNQLWVG